ncbi:MAG: MoxR family ATPase [Algoriphagus sp.]|jgi:MoxR-like ATPase|uniref:AAA family ATPase n=1 Tax=Algoriphagus sp. TaxID=1872435 RepID=UPI00276B305F|nr:MoxR family ATPase [Algoriphagus sp.]MDP4748433.1 MoxR family ATPase [Algoriphagus sp.]MDP4839390.1 MoxR family ATPase [Algoriphagus sp.]MDP4904469.1 MoxR family ATPase [Algoriphagus sp.]MDP4957660.1 MoxR family ATPase [Algoriphagus sp.]
MHQEKIAEVIQEVKKVVVGQDKMINRLLIGLFTNGHILLEGVPGLAKTLTVNTLAKVLHLDFNRIQFTPDLLPADLIGTMIYNQQASSFEVKKGPIFSNVILADEVNRSPAKVQSALLEAMQEKQVTIGETTYPLDRPFLVLATQNPVDQEGTYPLPEAQVDRFMMKVHIDYPSKSDEMEVMRRMSNMQYTADVQPILSKQDIFDIRDQINKVTLAEPLEHYIIELVFATRFPKDYGLKDEAKYILFGVSPRASINLNLAAKAVAFMDGRDYVLPEDIKEIAEDVLNHRILLNYEAEADQVSTRDLVRTLLEKVPINKSVTLK